MSVSVPPAEKPPANRRPQPIASGEFVELTPAQENARKRRNLMLALAIAGFIALVFFITIARIKAGGAP